MTYEEQVRRSAALEKRRAALEAKILAHDAANEPLKAAERGLARRGTVPMAEIIQHQRRMILHVAEQRDLLQELVSLEIEDRAFLFEQYRALAAERDRLASAVDQLSFSHGGLVARLH